MELPDRPELRAPDWAELDARLRSELNAVRALVWSRAEAVDAGEALPVGHFEAFAGAGLYGAFAPVEQGGLGLSYGQVCAVVEELASACLVTTFVWAQHFRFLGAMLDPATPEPLRKQWLAPAITGTAKGGVALTGLMPGPSRLWAAPVGDSWALEGEAPWVSGWDMLEKLVVVARGPGESVVSFLLDATGQPGLSAAPARLSALNASRTVRLRFDGFRVGEDRVLGQGPIGTVHQQSERLRLNGSFALGVAKRCCLLAGPSPLDDDLRRCRQALDDADGTTMPSARAAACELAMRSAHSLAVRRGSRSALAGDVAERASREAALLLVFASRPAIRAALLSRLDGSGEGP